MVLGCGLLARAEVGAVVKVHAVGDVREALRCAGQLHLREELIFAVKAALGVVSLVVGAFQLVGLKDLDWDVVVGGKGEGGGEFGAGE